MGDMVVGFVNLGGQLLGSLKIAIDSAIWILFLLGLLYNGEYRSNVGYVESIASVSSLFGAGSWSSKVMPKMGRPVQKSLTTTNCRKTSV